MLRLEMESKTRCEDKNAMDTYHRAVVNNLGESFENSNYTCCSTSCCNQNSVSKDEETQTTLGTTANVQSNDGSQSNTKSSGGTGKYFILKVFFQF